MKAQLNQNNSALQAGEVALFRSMMNILNSNGCKTVFCEETHQHRVSFYDTRCNKVGCEISDLLLVSLDKRTKKARISWLQAKREKKMMIAPNYQFHADFKQLYLLSQRPYIYSKEYPCDALNFSPAMSLATDGVFYNDSNGVDFFYTAAGCLRKNSTAIKRGAVVLDNFYHRPLPLMGLYYFDNQQYDEMIVIDGADTFEKSLVAWKIGAVLPQTGMFFLQHIFHVASTRLRSKLSNSSAADSDDVHASLRNLESLAGELRFNLDDDSWSEEESRLPSIAIVQCDSERNMD